MTTFTQPASSTGFPGWLSRAETWMDDKGRGAWIAAMILAFVFVWPLGLALLAYMIWRKKMHCTSARRRNTSSYHLAQRSTGNAAFDAYKSETLRRLEDEQGNFEAFLQRLRDARDKAEFDEFMDERAKSTASEGTSESST